MISSENDGKATEESQFPCTVYRKGGGSNSLPVLQLLIA